MIRRSVNARTRPGFTLVELLVVIGIIAVLIGILLPVLGRAREAANAAACASNMRSAAQAVLLYATENNGWIPGPNTSGALYWNNLNAINGTASEDTRATQNFDWMSPTLGMLYELPGRDIDRLVAVLSTQLRCPSNSRSNDYIYSGGSNVDSVGGVKASDVPFASYSMTTMFALLNRFDSEAMTAASGGTVRYVHNRTGTPAAWIVLPRGYAPKVTKIGAAAEKAMLQEGGRYVTTAGLVSFNDARFQWEGGNFGVMGMPIADSNEPAYLGYVGKYDGGDPRTKYWKHLAWRHRGRMNVAFYDGHVESMAPQDCIPLKLYVPRRTSIVPGGGQYIQDPEVSDSWVAP